jgi:hypothetical protein
MERLTLSLPAGAAGPVSARSVVQVIFKTGFDVDRWASIYTTWKNIELSRLRCSTSMGGSHDTTAHIVFRRVSAAARTRRRGVWARWRPVSRYANPAAGSAPDVVPRSDARTDADRGGERACLDQQRSGRKVHGSVPPIGWDDRGSE